VADMHPFDRATAPQRFGQSIQAVADDAIDALDAGCGRVSTIMSATVRAICLLPPRSIPESRLSRRHPMRWR
jgi:hypothetical protein